MAMKGVLDMVGSVTPYSFKFWEWADEPWSARDIPNLRGKVAIVTGGNGGVGREACIELVRHGAHVFLGARSEEKFRIAQEAIARRLSREPMESDEDAAIHLGKIEYLHCNLSNIQGAQYAANSFLERSPTRCDIFIACAGQYPGRSKINEDGYESLMATACVNHMVLLRRVLPLMIKSGKGQDLSSRIVFVSSCAHRWSSLPGFLIRQPNYRSWDDVNDLRRSDNMRYAQSKLAQILLVKRLNWELGDANVSCIALHPGEVNNNFVQQHFIVPAKRFGLVALARSFPGLLSLFLLDAREGARTCLFAATAKEVDERKWRGVYLSYPCALQAPSRLACDMELAQRCWTLVNNAIDSKLKP